MTKGRAILLVAGAALLFSTGGAAVKGASYSAWQIACFRSAVAAAVLLALRPDARTSWTRQTWLVGVSYCLTLTLFVHANKLTSAAATVFLQATSPLYLMLLAPLVLGERAERSTKLLVPFFGLGLALAFWGYPDASTLAPRPVLGNSLAALSGLCYALTLLGLRASGRSEQGQGGASGGGTLASVACGNLLAAATCLPGALPLPDLDPQALGIVAYLGLIQIAFAYVLLTAGIRRLTAVEVGLVLLIEPVFSPIWAAWAHAERPGALVVAGGVIIVAATVVQLLRSSRS